MEAKTLVALTSTVERDIEAADRIQAAGLHNQEQQRSKQLLPLKPAQPSPRAFAVPRGPDRLRSLSSRAASSTGLARPSYARSSDQPDENGMGRNVGPARLRHAVASGRWSEIAHKQTRSRRPRRSAATAH